MTSKREITLKGKQYPFTVKRIRRSKHMRLRVNPKNGIVITMPYLVPFKAADFFLSRHADWVEKQFERIKSLPQAINPKEERKRYLKYKEQTRELVTQRLKHFNAFYHFKYNKVAIRNQSTRWGSCSSSKNLNFNYKLSLIDPDLADYVIVHELCHTKEMNHGKRFWDLVEKTIPDYQSKRKKLKKLGLSVA